MVWAGIIIFETSTIWKTMKCKVTILIHDLEIHVANPRTDGRMERKFSHFHISRLLVLFLNDTANILPVLPDWEWIWIAGEISKALRALSSNLLFSRGLSAPQDGRFNPCVRSAWPTILSLAGEVPVCLHLGCSSGPCISGPDTQSRRLQWAVVTHFVLTSRAGLLWVDGPRSGTARTPQCRPCRYWASSSCNVSLQCPGQAPAPWRDETTCLLSSPAQSWGWYALGCILCFREIHWSWVTFQLCQEVTRILPKPWIVVTVDIARVLLFFSNVFLTSGLPW